MSSFFRNFAELSNARENAAKENLVCILSENAKEIQMECKELGGDDVLGLVECTSSLCTTLEAFFLHGLKDSFLWQTFTVMGGDADRRPEPSFWNPLLVFLHKQTIEQIQQLSQITSEVGCCRAWIRLSVSESFVSSYINNIRKNNSALNPYYKKHAMLRDIDMLEVAAKILEGLEAAAQIALPLNSTLLNRWPDLPLQLAGLWTPPLRSCLIADGVDVVSSLSNETAGIPTPKPLPCNELFVDSISNSPFNQITFASESSDLTDREHFQIFLTKVDQIDEKAGDDLTHFTIDKDASQLMRGNWSRRSSEQGISRGEDIGNSSVMKTSWAGIDIETCKKDEDSAAISEREFDFNRSTSMTQSVSSLKSPVDHHSYNTLLVRHRKTRELDWNDVWDRFETSVGITDHDNAIVVSNANVTGADPKDCSQEHDSSANSEDLNFEILPTTLCDKFTTEELHEMVRHACKLSREPGLDSQGFVCKSCAHPLGIGFAIAQVCAFTGQYFCEKCMSPELLVVPAKIIYNWDFRKYSVSKKAAAFMTEFQCQPFIDFKLLNPEIYSACDEMAALQSLRIRLNFIRAYLFTCCQPIIADLQKQVRSREYLYEYIHRYSMVDLTMIPRGTLSQLLHKAVAFGEQHILSCPLCSVKGFICEICNSPKVLYPFHLDTTFRCEICGAVFHDTCLNKMQPCPKCERKRKREDLPLIEAIQML